MQNLHWIILLVMIALTSIGAYRHPETFRKKIAFPLLAFLGLGILFISVYNIGGMGAHVHSLVKEVAKTQAETAVIKFYALRIEQRYALQVKSILVAGGLAVYLTVLIFLFKIFPAKGK